MRAIEPRVAFAASSSICTLPTGAYTRRAKTMTATTEPRRLTMGPKREESATRMRTKIQGMRLRDGVLAANSARTKAAMALRRTPVVVRSVLRRSSFTREFPLTCRDGFGIDKKRMSRIESDTTEIESSCFFPRSAAKISASFDSYGHGYGVLVT